LQRRRRDGGEEVQRSKAKLQAVAANAAEEAMSSVEKFERLARSSMEDRTNATRPETIGETEEVLQSITTEKEEVDVIMEDVVRAVQGTRIQMFEHH
jgi:hypothetical protein